MSESKNVKGWRIANEQAKNHAEQVCGCWSIRGDEFCEVYELDYEQAKDYECEQCSKDAERHYIYQELPRIENRVGKLTEEQEEVLFAKCEQECAEEEGYHFWDNLREQLGEKMNEKEHRELERNNYE